MTSQARRQTLYLVDGTAQLFRAYFAIRGLTNDEGLPTNALFGFTSMLRKLLREGRLDREPLLPEVHELVTPLDRLGGPGRNHVWLAESWIKGDREGPNGVIRPGGGRLEEC